MSDKLVLQALQTATIAAIAASIAPSLPVKMVARILDPLPDDQKYLEAVFIPNNPVDAYWGDEEIFQGTFRLILHWPVDDEGAYEAMEIANSIASYFIKSNTLYNGSFGVKITQVPKLTGALEAGHESLYPVSLSYRSFNP